MKIGILTQPLSNNYGGLMQAFALQTVLKKMGHDVWTINITLKETPLYVKLISIAKRIFCRFVFNRIMVIRVWPTKKETALIFKNINHFINTKIRLTVPIKAYIVQESVKQYSFDAYIVGSDQVWRPKYSPFLPNYFFDFLIGNTSVKRIAYAASFGIDSWEYTEEQTEMAKSLIQKFNRVSVREKYAVQLCKTYLSINPEIVLDPTFLLEKSDYVYLFNLDKHPSHDACLLTYILDQSPINNEIIKVLSAKLNLYPSNLMPENNFTEVGKKQITKTIYPPVDHWLKGIYDAKFVVTDSFHGTVFSIIFNKPFIVINNIERGLSRIHSILSQFELHNRLVSSAQNVTEDLIQKEINYFKINTILESERNRSITFLKNI